MISGPQNWRLPESPRWLVSAGHYAEAQRVIAALEPAPFHSDVVVEQTRVILDSLEGAKARKKTDVLTRGPTQHLRRMLIGASSQIMQQIGGCNAVIYFAPVIFQEELRLERNLSLIVSPIFGAERFFADLSRLSSVVSTSLSTLWQLSYAFTSSRGLDVASSSLSDRQDKPSPCSSSWPAPALVARKHSREPLWECSCTSSSSDLPGYSFPGELETTGRRAPRSVR